MDTTTALRDGRLTSPWQQENNIVSQAAGAQVYDCLIVGAGITGITTALLLQEAGKQVIIAEAHTVGFGTTGGTSAHINNFADTSYAEAKSAFGQEGAQLFANAIWEGVELINSNIKKYQIDCDYEEKTGYLYAENEDQVKQLAQIYEGLQQVGVGANYIDTVPTPVPFQQALGIPGQAQFHPIKYIRALANTFVKAGGILLENTFIENIEQQDGIHIANGRIRAKKVIYATHVPPGITVFTFRCAPYRSYVLGVTLKSGEYPDAMIYDSQEPYHYVRTHVVDGEQLLLVGGNDHKTGHDDPEKALADLEKYIRNYYHVSSVKYRWSSQYYVPADGFPYIGQIPFAADGIFCATGFNGNGMMLGSVSAKILADQVVGIVNEYSSVFSPSRIKPIDGFMDLVKENVDVAYHFVADRFGILETESLNRLHPGTGKVLELEGKKLAVYKDEAGTIHALSAVCTHAGCIINFNATECTWDCPCHGGRFATDGSVITGPPTKALKQISLNL